MVAYFKGLRDRAEAAEAERDRLRLERDDLRTDLKISRHETYEARQSLETFKPKE